MKNSINEMIDPLSTEDQQQLLCLLNLLVQAEQGKINNACFVVYQDNHIQYQGHSTRAALSVFTPLFSHAVNQLKCADSAACELVFFCIYDDCSVDVLGEVSS